jgi:hypothetical protein
MRKKIVSVIFLSGLVFITGLSVAQADILEWKKMSFEVSKPVPVLNSMTDVRGIFASPLICSGCHQHHYEEWNNSFHAKSVRNAGFQALFQKYLEFLKKDETKQALGREAGPHELRQCIFCHAPMIQFASDELVQQVADAVGKGRWEEIQGIQISCVVCHTIAPDRKWTGSFSQTGTMYGPIEDPAPESASGHQSRFSPLHKESRFCGICHSVKTFNVFCSLVFEQWEGVKGSKNCQDCHMEVEHEKVAVGGKERTGHSHSFPGGRSKETMAGALDLSLHVEKTSSNEVLIQVSMENKVPHNVPDG